MKSIGKKACKTKVIGTKLTSFLYLLHCVRSARILSFSGPHFPAFGLNTERYGVSLRIQSECGKIPTRNTARLARVDSHCKRACSAHCLILLANHYNSNDIVNNDSLSSVSCSIIYITYHSRQRVSNHPLFYEDPSYTAYPTTHFLQVLTNSYSSRSFCCLVSLTECVITPQLISFFYLMML